MSFVEYLKSKNLIWLDVLLPITLADVLKKLVIVLFDHLQRKLYLSETFFRDPTLVH